MKSIEQEIVGLLRLPVHCDSDQGDESKQDCIDHNSWEGLKGLSCVLKYFSYGLSEITHHTPPLYCCIF